MFSLGFNTDYYSTYQVPATTSSERREVEESKEEAASSCKDVLLSCLPSIFDVSSEKVQKLTEFDRIFNSEVFENYHAHLQNFVNEKMDEAFLDELYQKGSEHPFFEEARSLIELIQAKLPNKLKKRREFHETMIAQMRSL